MPRPANLEHPVYEGLTARERAALMRDYARACAEEPGVITEMVKRTGPAVFAAVWIVSYRAHQGKKRRARWPDEGRTPETAEQVRTRKRAARLRRAQNAAA